MDPIEAAHNAWDSADEYERRRLFVTLYTYLSVLDPVEMFLLEMQVKS